MINLFLKYIWRKLWFRISWYMGLPILPFVIVFHNNENIRYLLAFIYIFVLFLMCIFNENVEDIL